MSQTSSSAKGLERLGVTEDEVKVCKILMAQAEPNTLAHLTPKEDERQIEYTLGYSENRIKRAKALLRLGVTEDQLEVANLKALGSLGSEDRNQTKVEDIHSIWRGPTDDADAAMLTKHSNLMSELRDRHKPKISQPSSSAKGLERLGVTEDDVKVSKILLAQLPPNTGAKALLRLGVTKDQLEVANLKALGALGSEDRNQTKVEDIHSFWGGPTDDVDAMLKKHSNLMSKLRDRVHDAREKVAEKALLRLGVTEDELKFPNSRALGALGSEDRNQTKVEDVHSFWGGPGPTDDEDAMLKKHSNVLSELLDRGRNARKKVAEKALLRLGLTKDEPEFPNLKALGALGSEDRNQTKVEDVHSFWGGPGSTDDEDAMLKKHSNVLSELLDRGRNAREKVAEKALLRLGLTKDEPEFPNLKALGALRGEDQNREKSNQFFFLTIEKPIQTKLVKDINLFSGGPIADEGAVPTADEDKGVTKDSNLLSELLDRSRDASDAREKSFLRHCVGENDRPDEHQVAKLKAIEAMSLRGPVGCAYQKPKKNQVLKFFIGRKLQDTKLKAIRVMPLMVRLGVRTKK